MSANPDPAHPDVEAARSTAPSGAPHPGSAHPGAAEREGAHAEATHTGATDAESTHAEEENGETVSAADVVDPATVRRAPRLGRFAGTGVLLGLVLGTVVGAVLFRDAANRAMTTAVFVLDVTVVLVAVAIVWAIVSDRRSLRSGRGGVR